MSRPVKAFYCGRVLMGIIRSTPEGHVHMFYGMSGDGRVLTRADFWDRIKRVKATEHFVVVKDVNHDRR